MAKILGIDEAGRGPVIGPLVIAGVLISEEKEADLKRIGVKDSKLLSPRQREALFGKIIRMADSYDIRVIPVDAIDAAVESPSYNLNWLEADSGIDIINKLKPARAYIDCPSSNTGAFTSYIREKLNNSRTELIVEHKADLKYPAVSAASILAKVTRDAEIDKLKKRYGDFGSGYPSDPYTKEFIEKGYDLPIFRKSWATWKNAKDKKKQKVLDEF